MLTIEQILDQILIDVEHSLYLTELELEYLEKLEKLIEEESY